MIGHYTSALLAFTLDTYAGIDTLMGALDRVSAGVAPFRDGPGSVLGLDLGLALDSRHTPDAMLRTLGLARGWSLLEVVEA